MPELLEFPLRYVGSRFNGGKLPLDVLGDLPALRDLLVAYAKQLWLGQNAERQRVPKGFNQSLVFDLTGVGEGSALPKLNWDRDAAQANLPGFADELQTIVGAAYQRVVSLVADAANGTLPKSLPAEHMRALNRFGSGLHEGERIEFPGTFDRVGNVVYLDSARRRALITKISGTYEARYEGVGQLVGVLVPSDGSPAVITVQVDRYGSIPIKIDREQALSEFDGNIGEQVYLELDVELNNDDDFRSLVGFHGITLIDEKSSAYLETCRARLDVLKALPDNWDQEGGKAVSPAAHAAVLTFLFKRPALSSRYKIFASSEGGILVEFEANGWDFSVEFLPTSGLEFFGIEVNGTGELMPVHFDHVDSSFIKYFNSRVGQDGN